MGFRAKWNWVRYLSPFTEVVGKGQETFYRERECSESKSRVLDIEAIYCMGKQNLASWMGARNDGARTSEVRERTIPLGIVLSISNRIPDKRRFRVLGCFRPKRSFVSPSDLRSCWFFSTKAKTFRTAVKRFGGSLKTFISRVECQHYSWIKKLECQRLSFQKRISWAAGIVNALVAVPLEKRHGPTPSSLWPDPTYTVVNKIK
jgi:hypothetical protein